MKLAIENKRRRTHFGKLYRLYQRPAKLQGERREQIYRSVAFLPGRLVQRADNHCQHEFYYSSGKNAVNEIFSSDGR